MGSDDRVRIGLVGCVKTKLAHAAPAKELYISPLFVGRRAYVERTCDRWFVLSSLYGLVDPDDVIETYEQTLKGASTAVRRALARMVLDALDERLGDMSAIIFEIHAGKDYMDYGLAEGLRRRGARLDVPVHGLAMGEQLAFYNQHAAEHAVPCGLTVARRPAAVPKTRGIALDPVAMSADAVALATVSTTRGPVLHADVTLREQALDALAFMPRLVGLRDWPGDHTGLEHSGLYVWHVDMAGAQQLSAGLRHHVRAGRIYVGQAGATSSGGSSSDATLRSRIGLNHLGGNISSSTFRLTLAAVLVDELGLERLGPGRLSKQSEACLSEWIREHLAVGVFPIPDRSLVGAVEEDVVRTLDPPLNLQHCESSERRQALSALRKRLSRGSAPSERLERV